MKMIQKLYEPIKKAVVGGLSVALAACSTLPLPNLSTNLPQHYKDSEQGRFAYTQVRLRYPQGRPKLVKTLLDQDNDGTFDLEILTRLDFDGNTIRDRTTSTDSDKWAEFSYAWNKKGQLVGKKIKKSIGIETEFWFAYDQNGCMNHLSEDADMDGVSDMEKIWENDEHGYIVSLKQKLTESSEFREVKANGECLRSIVDKKIWE